MKSQNHMKLLATGLTAMLTIAWLTGCYETPDYGYTGGGYTGGGTGTGGNGGNGGNGGTPTTLPPLDPGTIINYPYETVYGDVCATYEATPGCTFNKDGTRVNVLQDPHYDRYGYQSDDLWFVVFTSSGAGDVYNDLGQYQYTSDVSNFAGYVGGTMVGVGTTGLFWESVVNGTYWLGKNGVLYNAMPSELNYGEAINNKDADDASDTSFASLNSDDNKKLVISATQKLQKDYGFSSTKAKAVATALNVWAVAGVERGYATTKDVDRTFKSVFGVDYKSALAAVHDLQGGDLSGMKDLTDRSAASLGLKPAQAQKFIKGMYKKALAQWGFDIDSIHW